MYACFYSLIVISLINLKILSVNLFRKLVLPTTLKVVQCSMLILVHWRKSTKDREGKPEPELLFQFRTICSVSNCSQRSKKKHLKYCYLSQGSLKNFKPFEHVQNLLWKFNMLSKNIHLVTQPPFMLETKDMKKTNR